MLSFQHQQQQLIDKIKEILTLPASFDYTTSPPTITNSVINDPSILSCGCILSLSFAQSLLDPCAKDLICPVCHKRSTIINEINPLRKLFDLIPKSVPQITPPTNSNNNTTAIGNSTTVANQPITESDEGNTSTSNKKDSLLSLFYTIAKNVNEEHKYSGDNANLNFNNLNLKSRSSSISGSAITVNNNNKSSSFSNSSISIPTATSISYSISNSFSNSFSNSVSNSLSNSIANSISTSHNQSTSSTILTTNISPHSQQEHEEYRFVKCFPLYRGQFHYSTHSKILKTKSKTFLNSSISPNCKYFALLSPKKFEVYEISSNSKTAPKLYCCGNKNGEFGENFENLKQSPSTNPAEIKGGITDDINKKLVDWEFLYCTLSNNLLVISGTNGIFRVFDLNKKGCPIYIYSSDFPIRCIAISPNSELIAYGITGKDRITGLEQALVVLHKLHFNSELIPKLVKIDPITITFPYRDPINTISFSNDSQYLSCSTALESRFLTVSIKNIHEPKLVMKSIRSLDTSLESEGITDIKMFPDNKYMIITSLAFNASPILIDNNISSINGLQTVAQPKLILKFDEIGSNIHRCCISPRNDSVAFLDKDGKVFLVYLSNFNNENKRIFLIDQVSNAFRMRESASLRFSTNGHKLFIVDRKGVLYINDFSIGLPQSSNVTKCKIINNN